MAKTVKQIYAELDKSGGYAADRKLLNQQLNALPNQYAAQAAGLDAKLSQANTNILNAARSRGLGWSGAPIEEQMQYAATEYAPALANLKTQSESNRLGILQALNSLTRDQRAQAQSIYDTNRAFAEQQRQFNEQQRLAREQMRAQNAASAQQAASMMDYYNRLSGNSEREEAIRKEAERLAQAEAKLNNSIANYRPGFSTQTYNGQRYIVPNF